MGDDDDRSIDSVFVDDAGATPSEAEQVLCIADITLGDQWTPERFAALMTSIRMAAQSEVCVFAPIGGLIPTAVAASHAKVDRLVLFDDSDAPQAPVIALARKVAKRTFGNTSLYLSHRGRCMNALIPDLPFGLTIASFGENPAENDLILSLAWLTNNPQAVLLVLPPEGEARTKLDERIRILGGRKLRLSAYGLCIIDRLSGSGLIAQIEQHIRR